MPTTDNKQVEQVRLHMKRAEDELAGLANGLRRLTNIYADLVQACHNLGPDHENLLRADMDRLQLAAENFRRAYTTAEQVCRNNF